MRLDPLAPPLREQPAVRASVDEKLGAGSGLSVAEAAARLTPVERVEWLLGELLVAMLDKRFHIWVQGYALGADPDFLRAVAGIAEVARPIRPRIAELLRWTVSRGIGARTGERPDALISVVPEVWNGIWEEVVPFLKSAIARWPESLDPLALPEPPQWRRDPVTASSDRPRFPSACVSLAAPGQAVERACFALWEAGASDDDLDTFFFDARGDALPEVLLAWVRVEGDPGLPAVQELLCPRHPLEVALGLEKFAWPTLIRCSHERLDAVAEAVSETAAVRIQPEPERPFGACVRSALRMDPDLLVVDAQDLSLEDVPLLQTALETGHLVVLAGDSEGAQALEAAAAKGQVPILRA